MQWNTLSTIQFDINKQKSSANCSRKYTQLLKKVYLKTWCVFVLEPLFGEYYIAQNSFEPDLEPDFAPDFEPDFEPRRTERSVQHIHANTAFPRKTQWLQNHLRTDYAETNFAARNETCLAFPRKHILRNIFYLFTLEVSQTTICNAAFCETYLLPIYSLQY